MIEYVTKENIAEYESFVEQHPQGSYMQSSRWARQKPDWQWRGIIRRNRRGVITGTLGLLIRESVAVRGSMIYGCHGPVCDPSDRDTIYELLDAAKKFGRRGRAYLIRFDPSMQEIARAHFEAKGFRSRNPGRRKKTVPSRRVWQIPVDAGSVENLMDTFTEEHRRRVRIAVQRGVEVRSGGRELVATFSQLMEIEGLREQSLGKPVEYYAGLLENYGDRARIYVAEYEGRTAAAALVIRFGTKATCIHEADDGDYHLRARYLLRAMILHQSALDGCTECEFTEVPRDPDTEEYAFVSGFGGWLTNYVGELDRIDRPVANMVAGLFRKINQKIKRWLYLLKIR